MTARDLFTHTGAEPAGKATRDATTSPAPASGCCGNCGHGRLKENGFVACSQRPSWEAMSPRSCCVKWVEMPPEKKAKREAQEGIDRAVGAADRQHEGWSDVAFAFIELFVVQHRGQRFTGHDIVRASKEKGVIQPENSRAWGGPIQRAARAGLIKRVGFTEDPNRHGNPIPLWGAA